MEITITRLDLRSPFYVIPDRDDDPFAFRAKTEGGSVPPGSVPPRDVEKLYCFELDKTLYRSFEPEKTKLPGTLVFGGAAAGERPAAAGNAAMGELPRGDYLFAQDRSILSKEDIIDLAVEIQMEGLWQRLGLGQRLYLRYLYEDGSYVTQLFRPYYSLTASTM